MCTYIHIFLWMSVVIQVFTKLVGHFRAQIVWKISSSLQFVVRMAQLPAKNPFRINNKNALKQNQKSSYSFRPIYIVSRIFGQMPFSIEFDSNGVIHRPTVNRLDAFWFSLSIIAFTFFMYPSFKYYTSRQNFNSISPISYVNNFCLFGSNSMLSISAIILDMFFRFKFVNIFKEITIFDQKAS